MEAIQAVEDSRKELASRVDTLEYACTRMAEMMAEALSGSDQYYTVTFAPGHIGMILTSDDAGNIEVAELRDDPQTRRPLLAKASGKISPGDFVIAINHKVLSRYGPATLEQVAQEFKNSPRPCTVLFQKSPGPRSYIVGGSM